jgi:hypothetical protein
VKANLTSSVLDYMTAPRLSNQNIETVKVVDGTIASVLISSSKMIGKPQNPEDL